VDASLSFRKLSDELVTPLCPRVAEVQVRYGFGLNALRAGISRSAASAFPNAKFDHKDADIISECRNCCSIGSPIDGIKDAVGPIVSLLEVGSDFVLREFVRERAFLAACYVPCNR
jgi:hypothetical protein